MLPAQLVQFPNWKLHEGYVAARNEKGYFNKLLTVRNEVAMACLYAANICLQGLRENVKRFGWNNRSPSLESKSKPSASFDSDYFCEA
jgi:hypothetical protein